MTISQTTSVLIVGGGPCGLMLANELGRRGIAAILVDEKLGTAFNPQANATQARSMEHYRRLGFANEIRAAGLPADYPTDVAYFTRYTGFQLARFQLPPSGKATELVRGLSGSWSAAELPHRVSQKYVEQVLCRQAEALPGISLRFGWRLVEFSEDEGGVSAQVERVADGQGCTIKAAFLVGADGPRSTVRQSLGISYGGESGIQRDFMGGRMLAVYLRAPGFYEAVPHPRAWMYNCFNRDRRAFMASVNGRDEFAFHTQLRPGEELTLNEDVARKAFQSACGAEIGCEVLSFLTWTAGHALVADGMQRGRVFLGGDAAHLFTPTGGLGYNTAIEDAVNLGWKIASVLKGASPVALMESYAAERRPVAVRNTGYARQFADSIGHYEAASGIEDDTPEGHEARLAAGAYLEAHARAEFNIPGVTFGGRYDGSPVIVGDGSRPPPDGANVYTPSACPGGRAPHAWFEGGVSLYDLFGFEWTLIQFTDDETSAEAFGRAAKQHGIDLKIVRAPAALRDLYEADVALIRPDQIVAWRGSSQCSDRASLVLGTALGHSAVN